jgi:hypothetical protein
MDCELNGLKIKYDEGKMWAWREMWSKHKLKNPYWFELKGCVNKGNGYKVVGINNKLYPYHRVVYFLHNNEWDIHDTSRDNSIDHIDRDKLNNSIENLRVVTNQQNMWNQNRKGYYFHKPNGKYVAYISVDGKQKHLGCFVSEDDARNAYLLAKEKYHIF